MAETHRSNSQRRTATALLRSPRRFIVDRPELAKAIRQVAYLTGSFQLRSGQTSSFYWDKYRFESSPELLRAIAGHMQSLLPAEFDRLAGLELGGIPLTTALSLHTGKPSLYVRKHAKDYGTCNLVEGGFRRDETIVLVEDVITTAGQVAESVCEMRSLGLQVGHVVCVIDRQGGGQQRLAKINCTLRPLFTLDELERTVQTESS